MKLSSLFFTGLFLSSGLTCTLLVDRISPDRCEQNRCDGTLFFECTPEAVEKLPVDCAAIDASCEISGCVPNCPNGVIDANEQCDGFDLGGNDCSSATAGALPTGSLACNPASCQFDTSACAPQGGSCNNGTLDPGEECDGQNFGGESCDSATNGQRPNGQLSCDPASCTIDTGNCTQGGSNCGNGTQDPQEECDDGNTANGDGCDSACQLETPGCVGGAPNDNLQAGEACDGNNLNGQSCASLGLEPGPGLQCNNQCGFNVQQCQG